MGDGNKNKDKVAKRLETNTIARILENLSHNGPQNRTNTSTRCNMSYTRFIPYMNFMMVINVIIFDPAQLLHITEIGKELLEYLLSDKEEED